MPYVINASDRELFRSCRRAWNFSAGERENYEPVAPDLVRSFARAIRDALGVYYFPGMWNWNRAIVRPLVKQAFLRAMENQRGAGADEPWETRCDAGCELLERYIEWAEPMDRFVPLRVGTEFVVNIPDPSRANVDLTTVAGDAIRYRGRIDLLVQDEKGAYWLVHHRIGSDQFATAADLSADVRGLSLCWAWEHFFLGMTISGTIYNELRADASFRRTVVPRDRVELERVHDEIARDARLMTSPSVAIDPCFAREACSRCVFKLPCIATSERRDVAGILRVAYRKRARAEAGMPRLGEMHSGMGRALFVRDRTMSS